MRTFKTSTQYRKDLKRYKNKPEKLQALKTVLEFTRMHVVVRHCRGEKFFARIKTCKFFNVLVNANREENVPEKQKCP
ncbi:MAG: hypothetical protein IKO99_12280 [Bacteroidales bacterium]|nr:hypothetical protein [Bacteroidales bacterium]